MDIYERLRELQIELPPTPAAGGIYNTVVVTGDMCCTSGHNCKVNGVLPRAGKLGKELSIEEGRMDARQCILNILSSLHAELGDLNRIEKIISIFAFVASSDDFYGQPKVLDAASELLIQIFGDNGKATRSAIGVNVLPNNQPVEIQLTCKLKI